MLELVDLERKGLLGHRMTQELLDKGLVSVLDLRFHTIKECYGFRRSDHSESRRLRQTLRDMGMIWTRFIDFDKGVETFGMAAFEQMCIDFEDVSELLRTRLVHAQLLDFYIRFFPEALFGLFNDQSDQVQIRCRSALLLYANRISKQARQLGCYRNYERSVLLLQAQSLNFSRAGRYRQAMPYWRAFVDKAFDWLRLFYFTAREREQLQAVGFKLPEALDVERIHVERERLFLPSMQQRVLAFIGQLRRLNDLFYTCDEQQIQQAMAHLPVHCLPDEAQKQVVHLTTNIGRCPALLVVRLFLACSPSPTCRYFNFRMTQQDGVKGLSRPYICQADYERVQEDLLFGRGLWSTWLPEGCRDLMGSRGIKLHITPRERDLLRQEGLPIGIQQLYAILYMAYDVEYIRIENKEGFIDKTRYPQFRLQQIVEWAAQVKERIPLGVSVSLNEALQGVNPLDHVLLLPLVQAAANKYRLPLPDGEGCICTKASSRFTRDSLIAILRDKGEPMTVEELQQALSSRFPNLVFDLESLRTKVLHDTRFVALKRTGYYGLSDWQAEGHLVLRQRTLLFLQQQEQPVAIERLLQHLQHTHPALSIKNLRALLRSLQRKEVVYFGLGYYGMADHDYAGFIPLSVFLRSDPAFETHFQELKGYITEHGVMPMTADPEGLRLALWWNRFDEGATRLTQAQRKQVVALRSRISLEGIPSTPEERLFRDRCQALSALVRQAHGLPDSGELVVWYHDVVERRTRWNGVYKGYVRQLQQVIQGV